MLRVNLNADEIAADQINREFDQAITRGLLPAFIANSNGTRQEKLVLFYNFLFYNAYGYETEDIGELRRVNRDKIKENDEWIMDSVGNEQMPTLGELLYFRHYVLISERTAFTVVARIQLRANTTLHNLVRCPTCTVLVRNEEAHSVGPCGHSFCTDCLNQAQAHSAQIRRRLERREAYIYRGPRRFNCPFCRQKVDVAIPIFRP